MTSRRAIELAILRLRPCYWCGAQPGKPCRANKGRGRELVNCVHTTRQKASDPDPDPGPGPQAGGS